MKFGPILTYLDCGYNYVPNGRFWGSTSRPHIKDLNSEQDHDVQELVYNHQDLCITTRIFAKPPGSLA